jgi:hypothetical protein
MTMAVNWNRGTSAPEGQNGPLVADRNLYLDASGHRVVEEGDAASASQFVAAGHPISQADADRLGLVQKGDRIEQDRAVKIGEHQALVDQLEAERTAFYAKVDQYKRENATKEIPNTMEAARVALETRYEHAVLALGQFIKAAGGKDPLRGESQATALRPETSAVAREATAQANAAVAASPSPRQLAANAPTAPAEVSPQHPDTSSSEATRVSAVPSDPSGALSPRAGKPDAATSEPAAKSAKKSAAKSAKKSAAKSAKKSAAKSADKKSSARKKE